MFRQTKALYLPKVDFSLFVFGAVMRLISYNSRRSKKWLNKILSEKETEHKKILTKFSCGGITALEILSEDVIGWEFVNLGFYTCAHTWYKERNSNLQTIKCTGYHTYMYWHKNDFQSAMMIIIVYSLFL